MVPTARIELATYGLRISCSTPSDIPNYLAITAAYHVLGTEYIFFGYCGYTTFSISSYY